MKILNTYFKTIKGGIYYLFIYFEKIDFLFSLFYILLYLVVYRLPAYNCLAEFEFIL